jgi:hypothetical protein
MVFNNRGRMGTYDDAVSLALALACGALNSEAETQAGQERVAVVVAVVEKAALILE